MHTEYWWGNLLENVLLETRERDERMILRRILGRIELVQERVQ